MHMPAAYMHGGTHHLVWGQVGHEHAYGYHVRYGVQGADFVEVDFGDRHPVGMAFGLGNLAVNGQGVGADLFRQV